jgi:hypothetical protein
MSIPDIAAGILGGLPQPLDAVALIVITLLIAATLMIATDVLLTMGPRWVKLRWLEWRAARMVCRQRAREDVLARARGREFVTWDASDDLPFRSQIGGWHK